MSGIVLPDVRPWANNNQACGGELMYALTSRMDTDATCLLELRKFEMRTLQRKPQRARRASRKRESFLDIAAREQIAPNAVAAR